ncbi:Hypothetical predicted protein [Paramuricea clavata]|uniref:Uncharacterized protein n=1 Tax=Paramuricea clavata TaxID=317549 RepID=A0A6S7J111_PARCT|nr:Hypothetical predicted protein [Paramuricea clavata]
MQELINAINVNKAPGYDNISPKFLKLSSDGVTEPLTKLFIYCIVNATWPSGWKLSNVCSAFKKGDSTNKKIPPNNPTDMSFQNILRRLNRPTAASFLPVFSDNMSGFLPGHSCYTALLKMAVDWRESLDKGQDVAVIAIDLSKLAFDFICIINYWQSCELMAYLTLL